MPKGLYSERLSYRNEGQEYDPLNGSDDDSQHGANHHIVSSIAGSLLPEVLVGVFSQLNPEDLDACSLVCSHWHWVLQDDASWRGSFERMFAAHRFYRVSPSLKWRTELLTRLDIIHKWRKGTSKNLSFNGQMSHISHVYADFAFSRAILFSQAIGFGAIADPTKGKLATPRVYTDKALQVTSDVVSVDGSRFGMVFGMIDGRVNTVLFSPDTRIHDYVVMKERPHQGAVTAAWINPAESPRQNNTDSRKFFGALTGDVTGQLCSWDLEEGLLMRAYKPPSVRPSPVVAITCDHRRDCALFALESGEVFGVFSHDSDPIALGKVPFGGQEHNLTFFQADFAAGYVVFATEHGIARVMITPDAEEQQISSFEVDGKITAVALDSTNFHQPGIANRDVPGKEGRYLAAATSADLIYVWNLEHEDLPIRVTPSPFQVDIPNLHGVTALALNSAVLLLGSYNGVTIAYELLTGEYLRIVSSRFSKRALNMRTLPHRDNSHPGLVPITALALDADPSNPHGMIVVGSAVQYFDFGANVESSGVKKRGVRKKRRGPQFNYDSSDMSRSDLNRDIENDLELMGVEDQEVAELRMHNERMDELFGADGLTEDDQLQYALMLSQDQSRIPSTSSGTMLFQTEANAASGEDDNSDEFSRAIEQSLDSDRPEDSESEQLRRAIELSLADNATGNVSSESSREADADGDDIWEPTSESSKSALDNANRRDLASVQPQSNFDSDLDFAIRLSLAEQDSTRTGHHR